MLKRILNLFLYSNVFIAVCAVSLLWSSELLAFQEVVLSPFDGLVFAASLFVYSAHRLVGIHKQKAAQVNKRHALIQRIEPLVIGLASLGLIASVFFFFGLSDMQQVLLVFPAVVSIAYIVPFSRNGKRLRDYPFIKVFLIAYTWAWVTVIVPMWELQVDGLWWLFFERFFFILAITLPFDIRDILLDRRQEVKTIPVLIGTKRTKKLSFLMLGISLMIGIIYLLAFSLQYKMLNGYLVAGLYTFFLLRKVRKGAPDYLFTGYLDGTMIVQFVLLQAFVYFFN